MPKEYITVQAIEFNQGKKRKLYCFVVDGKKIPNFATISRISRSGESVLGYQRPEVISHVADIKNYLESENPIIPNSIVIAFNETVKFIPSKSAGEDKLSRGGFLEIPLTHSVNPSDKPGWIVDGQQRAAAIREAKIKSFPITVVGFIAKSDREQREQFILVNSTKPLPKGLVYELLPSTDSNLPLSLKKKRFPMHLLNKLNFENDSPLFNLIKTPTMPNGVIKDNSIVKMLENSLLDGVLFRYWDDNAPLENVEKMLNVLKSFWKAVSIVFEDAWGLPPRRSRLMHGAGVVSLGFLMDAISERYKKKIIPTLDCFINDLNFIKGNCCWVDGHWDFGDGIVKKWNEVQNTPKDVQCLANFLLQRYRQKCWSLTE
jgi:DGQHR domain-containing protein